MMPTLDFFEGTAADPAAVAFRDLLFLMVLSLVVVIFLLTFLINPVPEQEEAPARSQIFIEAFWPSGTAYDVDLWAMGPDEVPVGWGLYSAGPNLNLERDDRGRINDTSELNYEVITVRAREAGEYLVNLHLYNHFGEPLPVPVRVKITGRGDLGRIWSGETTLDALGDETTVIRFALNGEGHVVPDSLHDLDRCIICR